MVYEADPFNPWLAQDQAFVEAVRSKDPGLLQSDYHDGLRSLAPILACWDSTRRDGHLRGRGGVYRGGVSWTIEYTDTALNDLRKLDKRTILRIVNRFPGLQRPP